MILTKSKLASELDCSPSTITRLVSLGLKPRPDGKLDREKALRFIVDSTSGAGGGWQRESGHGKLSLHDRAEVLLDSPKQPKRKASHKSFNDLPPSFAYGMAFLAERLRDEERLEGLKDVAMEAMGLSEDNALNMAKLFAYLAGGWISEYLPLTGKQYERRFKRELKTWFMTNLRFAEDK
jgi:hypothetical protein